MNVSHLPLSAAIPGEEEKSTGLIPNEKINFFRCFFIPSHCSFPNQFTDHSKETIPGKNRDFFLRSLIVISGGMHVFASCCDCLEITWVFSHAGKPGNDKINAAVTGKKVERDGGAHSGGFSLPGRILNR